MKENRRSLFVAVKWEENKCSGVLESYFCV